MYLYHYAKFTGAQLRHIAKGFCRMRRLRELASYFQLSLNKLKKCADHPNYYTFDLLKPDGNFRRIDTPRQPLKQFQAQLNFVLQSVYFQLRPQCVYGFVISAKNEDTPRNIYTHACCHLGQKWVLNLDLKDFFHSISIKQVKRIFKGANFSFTPKAADYLSRLTTFQGRLPMGAPSSPIISNFAAVSLDEKLQALAEQHKWVYTRFSDDLTFSGQKKISKMQIRAIEAIIRDCGFEPHSDKMVQQHIDDPPEVTGLLLLKDYPDVSPAYLQSIKDDMKLLEWMGSRRAYQSSNIRRQIFNRYVQSIRGKINFVGFVRGRQHSSYRKLMKKLHKFTTEGCV